uniref:Uncharacterized protein n=1 Tax=Arundo donax TaxID=35708 RepID=A0A0A9HD22_ARUDO
MFFHLKLWYMSLIYLKFFIRFEMCLVNYSSQCTALVLTISLETGNFTKIIFKDQSHLSLAT